MGFGEILYTLRTNAGLSVYRLARLAGVSESAIRYYESGGAATVDKADRLLRALGATLVLGDRSDET